MAIMSNVSTNGLRENEILERGIELLITSLPDDWQVQQLSDGQPGDSLADAVLNIGGPQMSTRVVVEVKTAFRPKDIDAVERQARLLSRVAGNIPVLVMAPWLSDRTRTLLTERRINYLDLTGNVRLESAYPTIYISRESNVRGPKRSQSIPSLKGLKAGRVARLLTDVQPPYGVMELAKYAQVTPGYVSRLLETLEGEGLVERGPKRTVVRADWQELLRRRAESYGIFTTNRIQRFVCPNGAASALELAGDIPTGRYPVALTGSFAAERIVSVAPPTLLILYTPVEAHPLIQSAGLLPTESGANVVLAIPYDTIVMESRWPEKPQLPARIPLVAASQIVLDCLTGNGRMPQEAEALLGWMALNEA